MLHLNAKAAREVEWAIEELAAGKYRQALKRLCLIRGVKVPELKVPKKFLTRLVEPPTVKITTPLPNWSGRAPIPINEPARPIHPQPKPSRRLVSRDVVADFRVNHIRCSVLGCPNGDADPHHIWPRGRGGPDEAANLIALCPGPRGHHEEIERIDAEAFAAKYASRLSHEVLLKLKLALVREANAKLTGPAVDAEEA